jgi:hypothetical protein
MQQPEDVMVKTPIFEQRRMFGASSDGQPVSAPEAIQVGHGAEVFLRYEGKSVVVRVTKVLAAQAEFEGEVETFEDHELAHRELKHGDQVVFSYENIEHIYKPGSIA